MTLGIISTQEVRVAPSGLAVEVVASLDEGEVVPGMFVLIPLNRDTSVAVTIAAVEAKPAGALRLTLDCDDDAEHADMVAGLNFAGETLWVVENLRSYAPEDCASSAGPAIS